MKDDIAISLGTLRTSKQSLLHWKKSMEFKKESLVKSKKVLKSV